MFLAFWLLNEGLNSLSELRNMKFSLIILFIWSQVSPVPFDFQLF